MITLDVLRAVCINTPAERLALFVEPLNRTIEEFSIRKVPRFLAQTAHESWGYMRLEENLNYSAKRLAQVWKRYAVNPDAAPADRQPNQLAVMLAGEGPEAIANNVYANRLGNGDEASGDGWRHRGSGILQLTGADNQRAAAEHFGIAIEDIGDWLRTPEGAARSAGLYWDRNRLDAIEDFERLGAKINGTGNLPPIGAADRYALLGRAERALA